jgi:hypothetical protein
MSERLSGLYDTVQAFIHKELSTFDESEVEQIHDIMSDWHLIIVNVQSIRHRLKQAQEDC